MTAPPFPSSSDVAEQIAQGASPQDASHDASFDHGFGADPEHDGTSLADQRTRPGTARVSTEPGSGAGVPGAAQATDPAQPEDPETPEDETVDIEAAVEALYGTQCPIMLEHADEEDWVNWGYDLWDRHRSGVQRRLHMVERNRMFRSGIQWISAVGYGPWREPPKPRDTARLVYNMIDKALDQRVEILIEQRPGFRTNPQTQDPMTMKQAEAQQMAIEYQYANQKMEEIIGEAAYWVGTDGVGFLVGGWDPDKQAWQAPDKGVGNQDQTTNPQAVKANIGDCETEFYRMEQCRVSANATATIKPIYWVFRKTIPLAQAVARYGARVTEGANETRSGDTTLSLDRGLVRNMFLLPSIDELQKDQQTVDVIRVYCEPSEFLPKGLQLTIVGERLTYKGALLFGVVPAIRMTDGSTDPAFYPAPIMEQWIEAQIQVNAVFSKWVESIRRNSDGRIFARGGALSMETLVGGTLTVVDVKNTTGPIGDSVMPMQGFSVGEDAKEFFQIAKKAFEDASGWNDASRGSFEGEPSGRAILATREQLERIFTPGVLAAARAMSRWGEVMCHIMAWGYEVPRQIQMLGNARSDLGNVLSQDMFQNVANVEIDPETLIPVPRAMRLFILDDMFQKGLMTGPEYRRRMPYGWTKSLESPDEDQYARAKRIADAIRRSGNADALPVLWQDNEAIHQDVLERELIFPDDTPPPIRQAAQARWQELAAQAKSKAAPPQPAPGSPEAMFGQFMTQLQQADLAVVVKYLKGELPLLGSAQPVAGAEPTPGAPTAPGAPPAAPAHHGQPVKMPPHDQPLLGTRPSVAAAPAAQMAGETEQQRAGLTFDQTHPI